MVALTRGTFLALLHGNPGKNGLDRHKMIVKAYQFDSISMHTSGTVLEAPRALCVCMPCDLVLLPDVARLIERSRR